MLQRLHGVRWLENGSGLWLFGIHFLLSVMEREFPPNPNDTRRGSHLWPNVWVDGLFLKALYKFHRVGHDAIHAAANLEKTLAAATATLRADGETARMDVVSSTTKDATLFLDLMLLYFRIQADCLAMVIPNLYGVAGQAVRPRARDSFRTHRKWFQGHRDFDPEYAAILDQHTKWFDSLSGEDEGWRDSLVHRFGTYQIELEISATYEVSLHVQIDAPVWPGGPNLLVELSDAVADYCRYLDALTVHFARRINSETTERLFDLENERACSCSFIPKGGSGLWILPLLRDP